MSTTTPGTATTYGRGGQVGGVIVRPRHPDGPRVQVHIVAEPVDSLPALAARVRDVVAEALASAAPDRAPWAVDVHVADLIGLEERRLR